MQHPDGFSLLELVIALLIVGILAGAAVPAWQSALFKARRNDAQLALSRIASLQEQFRLRHQRYAGPAELGTPLPAGLGMARTEKDYYVLAAELTDTGFTATATVKVAGPQGADETCWEFSIDAAGRKSSRRRDGRTSSAACWQS